MTVREQVPSDNAKAPTYLLQTGTPVCKVLMLYCPHQSRQSSKLFD